MSFHPLVLDDVRKEDKGRIAKTPFAHQLDAFEAMKNCFDFDKDEGLSFRPERAKPSRR
jgi:hypothetical protein